MFLHVQMTMSKKPNDRWQNAQRSLLYSLRFNICVVYTRDHEHTENRPFVPIMLLDGDGLEALVLKPEALEALVWAANVAISPR